MLTDIDLTAKDETELKNKLDAWRTQERKKIEEELTEKYEQMEASLKEEYETLVEDIKTQMQKVYAKRFTKALKEMYEEIKAEVIVESMNSPEQKALEEVKSVIYPFINEPTARRYRDEFTKLASLYENAIQENELLKGANKKANLMKGFTPEVSKVVERLLGEGTEEEIVSKFAVIKEALKTPEQKPNLQESDNAGDDEEGNDEEGNDDENQDNNEFAQMSVDEKEGDGEVEESKTNEDDFTKTLNEQLKLAGVKK